MVTLTDVDWDSASLLDMYWAVPREAQAKILLVVAQEACVSLLSDAPHFSTDRAASKDDAQFLEKVLWRCMPSLPWGWQGDQHWIDASMTEVFSNEFRGNIAGFVFTPECFMEQTATVLTQKFDMAIECANRVRNGQRFTEDELGTDVGSMKSFLIDWKDAFYELIREQQQVSDVQRLIKCMPLDTIVTDLWDWDIRFEEESFGDIEDAAFCDDEELDSVAEQLAVDFERWVDENEWDYNQNGFDSPEDFSAFVKEECLKFMKGWRRNVREEFGR